LGDIAYFAGMFAMPWPTVVCIATGDYHEWEAFCLDFDLAVRGRSFEEVKGDLSHAIHVYIDKTLDEPQPVRSQLLSREAPFSVRLTWAWRLFVTVIGRKRTLRQYTRVSGG
jgi:hypothetical protein